jgi:hypothetical protein
MATKNADPQRLALDELRFLHFLDVRHRSVGRRQQHFRRRLDPAVGVAEEPDHDCQRERRHQRQAPVQPVRQRKQIGRAHV